MLLRFSVPFYYLIKDGIVLARMRNYQVVLTKRNSIITALCNMKISSPTSSITRKLILQINNNRLKPRPTKRHPHSISPSSRPSGPSCGIYEYSSLPLCHFFTVHNPLCNLVVRLHQRGISLIVGVPSVDVRSPSFVDVSEEMDARCQSGQAGTEVLTASIFTVYSSVKNAERRAVRQPAE